MDQAVNPDLFSIFDVLIFVAPYILANRTSRNPGMGRKEGCMTRFVPSRYRLQAFVSTILKRLNKPPFLPQLCSTLSKLVCNPHHGTPPDRNRVAGYRRGLASLSVVKEPLFRVHRNVSYGCVAAAATNRQRLCLVGLIRPRCAASPSSSASLKPYKPPGNKKPGVERRVQPLTLEWLHAKLDRFLTSARKEPHYWIYFSPSLDLTLGRLSSTRP